MRVKTLIKRLQKLDPDSNIYSFMSILGKGAPRLDSKEFAYVELSDGRKVWESYSLFLKRRGRYKVRLIKRSVEHTI